MGRLAGSWKAEMNSLCSDNISAFSSKLQPSSKDPFVRNVFYNNHGSPVGRKACEPYQNFDVGVV